MGYISDMRNLFTTPELIKSHADWLPKYFGVDPDYENLKNIYNGAADEKVMFDKKRLELYRCMRAQFEDIVDDAVWSKKPSKTSLSLFEEQIDKMAEYVSRSKWLTELIFNLAPFIETEE